MKKFTQQLQTKASTIKLSTAERRELRGRVVSYMEYHPLPTSTTQSVAKPARSTAVEPFATIQFITFKPGRMWQWVGVTAAFMLVVTPVMAERAVPGDMLYAVKVQINEPVRSTLAFTPYQKVEWETQLLNRRLAEARVLASEGKLTEEVEEAIASAVKEHSENAKREIAALRETDAEEAALATIAFTTTLEVQSASLRSDSEGSALATANTTLLETVINETLTEQTQQETETTVLSFDKLMARVEINTTRVFELLESVEQVDTETKQAVNRRLEDIDRTIQEALARRGGDDQAAVPLLVDSLERSQRLILFLSELQSGQFAQVEKYVPVVLTAEEKQSYKDRSVKTLNDQKQFIATNLLNVVDPGTLEKMQVGLAEIESLMVLAESSSVFSDQQGFYEQAISVGRDTIELYYSLDLPVTTGTSTPVVEGVATTTAETIEEPVAEATSTESERGQ